MNKIYKILKNCVSNPCLNGATCINSLNSYTCQCPDSYAGSRCEIKVNYCASQPCQNNATCTNLVGGYSCLCPSGESKSLIP